MSPRIQVSVIGSGVEHEERAEEVGRLLAERGCTVVCGGGGRSFTPQFLESGHDCFVSSEFHHNHYLDAKAAGVTLVDGTHFATEMHIPQMLAQKLADEFPETDFFLASEQNPVITI